MANGPEKRRSRWTCTAETTKKVHKSNCGATFGMRREAINTPIFWAKNILRSFDGYSLNIFLVVRVIFPRWESTFLCESEADQSHFQVSEKPIYSLLQICYSRTARFLDETKSSRCKKRKKIWHWINIEKRENRRHTKHIISMACDVLCLADIRVHRLNELRLVMYSSAGAFFSIFFSHSQIFYFHIFVFTQIHSIHLKSLPCHLFGSMPDVVSFLSIISIFCVSAWMRISLTIPLSWFSWKHQSWRDATGFPCEHIFCCLLYVCHWIERWPHPLFIFYDAFVEEDFPFLIFYISFEGCFYKENKTPFVVAWSNLIPIHRKK